MTPWQIILCIAINAVWVIPFSLEIIIYPIRDHIRETKELKNDPNRHRMRIQCITCKYCKSETLWSGRYPNGFPHRHPVYCRLLKRPIRGGKTAICMMKRPPEAFFADQHPQIYPVGDVYISAYGDCYHSTPYCPSIKKSQHIHKTRLFLDERRPCPKCWIANGDELHPKQ